MGLYGGRTVFSMNLHLQSFNGRPLKINQNLKNKTVAIKSTNNTTNYLSMRDIPSIAFSGHLSLNTDKKTHALNNISFTAKNKNANFKNPYIFVHGTTLSKESIEPCYKAMKKSGFKAYLECYPSITKGERIEKSGLEVSKTVNNKRIAQTRINLKTLNKIKDDPKKLKDFFGITSSYSESNKIIDLLPEVIEKLDSLITQQDLNLNFSTHTKLIEEQLANKIQQINYGNRNPENKDLRSKKIAERIINVIAPKAVLVGHSMGGFVSYAIALNPKENLNDDNPFRYDAGNGIATVITLCSPIKSGVPYPLPPTFSNLTWDLIEEDYFSEMDSYMDKYSDPITSFWYNMWKGINKSILKSTSDTAAQGMNEFIYKNKPGFRQITEGSDFMKNYIENKTVPEGITAISYYSPEDGIAVEECCKLNEDNKNNHNISINIEISKEELKKAKKDDHQMTRSHLAHRLVALNPKQCNKAFEQKLLDQPEWAINLLSPENSDSIRYKTLQFLQKHINNDPKILTDNIELQAKLKEVAHERMPFKASPSTLAWEILKK